MILLGHDREVAEWAGQAWGNHDLTSNLLNAFGQVRNGQLVGAAVLHNMSRYDVELSYYGPGTITADMCKLCALAVWNAKLLRISIRMPRAVKHRTRTLVRLGFKFEGIARNLYGPGRQNDALMFGMVMAESTRFSVQALEMRLAA